MALFALVFGNGLVIMAAAAFGEEFFFGEAFSDADAELAQRDVKVVCPLAGGQSLSLVGELATAPAVVELDGFEPEALSDGIAFLQPLVDRDARNAELLRPFGHGTPFAVVFEDFSFRPLSVGRLARLLHLRRRDELRLLHGRLERALDRPPIRQSQAEYIVVDSKTRRPACERQSESMIFVCSTFHLSALNTSASPKPSLMR